MTDVLLVVVGCALILLDVLVIRWMKGGLEEGPARATESPPALPEVRYTDIRRCAAHGGPIQEDFPVEVHTDIALFAFAPEGRPLAVTLFICQPCASVANYGS